MICPLPDRKLWPKSEHGFMLHPPILKPIAGRRRTERYKGCGEKKKKGSHKCPICKGYGHRWQTCRNGDPDQMAAMLLERHDQFILNILLSFLCNQFSLTNFCFCRGPPKKRKKKTVQHGNNETSIVPAPTMMYPPGINQNNTSSTR